jgi:hypothetical protein
LKIGKNQKKGFLPKKAMISPNILADDFKPRLSAMVGAVIFLAARHCLIHLLGWKDGLHLGAGQKSRMPFFYPHLSKFWVTF